MDMERNMLIGPAGVNFGITYLTLRRSLAAYESTEAQEHLPGSLAENERALLKVERNLFRFLRFQGRRRDKSRSTLGGRLDVHIVAASTKAPRHSPGFSGETEHRKKSVNGADVPPCTVTDPRSD